MSALKRAVTALAATLRRPPHDRIVGVELFADLDVARVAKDLRLDERGRERGEQNRPPSDSEYWDDVEHELIERVERARKCDWQSFVDELSTYAQRLHALDISSHTSAIKTTTREAVSEFEAKVHQGRDELHRVREEVGERTRDLMAFQRAHGLSPAAAYPESLVFHAAIVALLLTVETALNGSLIAVGHSGGLLGGVITAFAVAAGNVGLGWFAGRHVLGNVLHRSVVRRLVGGAAIALTVVVCVVLNVGVGHYRDLLQGLEPENAGAAALEQMLAAPFGFAGVESWFLMGIGIAFSLIALLDGFKSDDPYPDFGRHDRLRAQSQEDYVARKQVSQHRSL